MGIVVVGVDGSKASAEAVRFAAAEARWRGATLRAVTAWRMPVGSYGPIVVPASLATDLEPAAKEVLTRQIDEVLGEHPDVPVELLVAEGTPARVLLDAAQGADLLVVGSRGHGGFTGLLLGSTSSQVMHHAACPTVVVPAPRPS